MNKTKKQNSKKRLKAFKQAIKDSNNFKFDELIDRWQFIEQRTDELLGEYKWKKQQEKLMNF